MDVRRALAADAAELTRLRRHMLLDMGRVDLHPDWDARAHATFVARLAEPGFAAFVIDDPERPRLLASGAGWLDRRLVQPSGVNVVGHVGSMSTDPAGRRRGYARAIITALLDWFTEQGALRVELNATDMGAPLYASLGFRAVDNALALTLPSASRTSN